MPLSSILRSMLRAASCGWALTSLSAGVIASLTGVYFLFFVIGGYQGGRNPFYEVMFLMSRQAWDLWHTWMGGLMIMTAVFHLILDWDWVLKAVKRSYKTLLTGHPKINRRARLNILINAVIGLSFLVTAVSGACP